MVDPLAGVDAKIERGFDHLREFEAVSRRFLEAHPYGIVHKVDSNGVGHIGVFHIVEEPPLDLGIIVGEALGQFRSALDHLMTELVRLHKPGSTRSVNFPIYSRDVYRSRSATNGPGPREQVRRLVRPEHLAVLDKLQPEPDGRGPAWPGGPRRSALFVLQWFTNVDKHQLIHPVLAAPRRITFPGDPNVRYYIGAMAHPWVLQEGTEMYHVLFVDETKMSVPLDLDIEFAMGPPPMMRMTVRDMRQFGRHVGDIVKEFRAITPEFRA